MKQFLHYDIRVSRKFGVTFLLLSFLALCFGAIIKTTQAASDFSDNFDDGIINASKWKLGVLTRSSSQFNAKVTVEEKNGYLSITPRSRTSRTGYNGLISVLRLNLTNGFASVKVAQKAGSNAQTVFSIGIDDGNFYRFRTRGSTLYLETAVNGRISTSSIASSSEPRYWRFRHIALSDSIIFETSSDSIIWVVRRITSRAIDISNLLVELNAGTSESVSSPSTALFDNFQLEQNGTIPTPTPTPTATPQTTPTPSVTPTPFPTPANDSSRGYLTTPVELAQIKSKAQQNIEPYKSSVNSLLSIAGNSTSWSYGTVDPTDRDNLQGAAAMVYAKALAYHLTGNDAYAASARQKILEISNTDTCPNDYSGGNGCILTLSRHIAGYVAAADLIEDYSGWTAQDKMTFQGWLRDDVYRFTDWASDMRSTNWGAVGTMTTLYIADYFAGSGLNLIDHNGNSITPHNAFVEARQRAFDRNNGNSYMYNSVCSNTTGLGIQYYGGIPEETGRDSTGCWGTYLLTDDSSYSYMIAHLSGTLPTAELLWRRGDPSLYNNIKSDGGGSILRAILFVIENPYDPNPPQHSFDWLNSRKSILEIAYRYYRHPAIAGQLGIGTSSRHIAGNDNTAMPHFGTLTHGFSVSENPAPPPVVLAP